MRETLADPDMLNTGSPGPQTAPFTTFTYDLAGNLAQQTDPSGNVLSYTYDNLNRKSTESTSAYTQGFTGAAPNYLAVTRTFGYDDVGNLASIVDRNGETRSFGYDALNRQASESWSDGRSMTFGYDDEGRRTGASDSGGPDFSYTYDNLGRMKTKSRSDSGPEVQWSFDYDDAGNRTAAIAKQGTTTLVSNAYAYNFMGEQRQVVQSVSGQADKSAIFEFDLVGRPTAVTRKTGTSIVAVGVYLYDGAGRLGSLSYAAGNNARGVYGMVRDKKDRITTLSVDGVARPMSYDANDQLLGATTTDEKYAYDANGNRTLAKTADPLGVRAERAATTGKDNRIARDGQSEYQYDKEGNRIVKLAGDVEFDIDAKAYPVSTGSATASYAYDLRNRLVGVSQMARSLPDGDMIRTEVVYTYDVDDNRTSRSVDNRDNNALDITESYASDGSDLSLVFDSAGNVSERVLNDPSGTAIAMDKGTGNTRWLLGDQVGSVRQVIDNNGALKDKIDYDTFGNVRSQTQPTESPRFTYAGGEIETVTGLVHFGRREYDAFTGGWLQQDPIGYGGGDTNLYRYVGNNPAPLIDRSGLVAQEIGGRLVQSTGGGVGAFLRTGSIVSGLINGISELLSGEVRSNVGSFLASDKPLPLRVYEQLSGASKGWWYDSVLNTASSRPATPIGSGVSSFSPTLAGIGSFWDDTKDWARQSWGGIKTIAGGQANVAFDQMQSQMADRYAAIMLRDNDTSLSHAIGLAAGDLTGATAALEAYYNVDLQEGRDLGRMERWQRGLAGGSGLTLSATGGAAMISSARAGFNLGIFAKSELGILGKGSTADLAKGTTLPRNLREQLGLEQAAASPAAGTKLRVNMTDPRWPSSQGWEKWQQIIKPGGDPINVHYLSNPVTGQIDDFKIVLPGAR
jgi:RHS repeat-associated protein